MFPFTFISTFHFHFHIWLSRSLNLFCSCSSKASSSMLSSGQVRMRMTGGGQQQVKRVFANEEEVLKKHMHNLRSSAFPKQMNFRPNSEQGEGGVICLPNIYIANFPLYQGYICLWTGGKTFLVWHNLPLFQLLPTRSTSPQCCSSQPKRGSSMSFSLHHPSSPSA